MDGSLHYTGEYYMLPGGRPKTTVFALSAGLLALFLLTALLPSAGGMWHIAAIPQLLELIPLIYLVMGAFCLARVNGPMTFRGWYASWRRLCTAALWSLIFCAAMVLAEAAFFIFGESFRIGEEILFLIRVIGCAVLSWFLWRYLKNNPCTQTVTGQSPEQDL